MNAQLKIKADDLQPVLSPAEEALLSKLIAEIATDDTLPEPDPESIFVGDGDYRAIGLEYLGHFVRIGGLKPHHRVLDIGCGIGRMAVPLTQYLDATASYEGIDPVNEGIQWCVRNISSVYPNFRFCHLDVAHELYNPQGTMAGNEIALPFAGNSFDFAFMTSVATHLPVNEIVSYAREIMRLLAPGGRLFLTAFIVVACDPERANARPQFLRGERSGTWIADPAAPLGAIGFDDGILQDILVSAGLKLERVSFGHWRGIESTHYQDVIIAVKPE
ncbi:class I SAM-dependent methyltransferase [Microvirga guangxiensis]|uniref:Methyltransferase domain-containing protein n=1 Tax=Microvirga guangxiensis TaxID=549386 RepID=A0A1G5LIZ3_9HYPH|nr:class I SAM-dependent methyltransferase [Microvirga guangxiensis]SCZ12278.1 Methyltransferase domain-containing protein [Microvirga guangxiensis]